MVCRHSIHFRSIGYGQIGMVELSKEALIGGANPRRQSRVKQIRIMEIKIEKGVILSQEHDTWENANDINSDTGPRLLQDRDDDFNLEEDFYQRHPDAPRCTNPPATHA
jgi:hypothetical protein